MLTKGLLLGKDRSELLEKAQEKKELIIEEIPQNNPKPVKGETKKITLDLYQQGKSIDEIVQLRHLAKTTIEGHLMAFIPTGELKISDFVNENKEKIIQALIQKMGAQTLTVYKQELGENYSFTEIKAVIMVGQLTS